MRDDVGRRLRIAITTGEPAGIGPDLMRNLAARYPGTDLVLVGDRNLLWERAGCTPDQVRHVSLRTASIPGHLNPANAPYVLETLDVALAGCLDGKFDAMVTAPLHKGVINEFGLTFTGHTEYLAEKTRTSKVVMMLAGGGLRVALVTTHLPLTQVPKAITSKEVEQTVRIVHAALQNHWGIPEPRILVAGLNPHAGESGHMGREEIEVIEPVLVRLQGEGMDLVGPLPADTLFTTRVLQGSDAQIVMYHDQGLGVLKYASFGHATNITLGLPVIRTSVDHGTALDLAGTEHADNGSLLTAITEAIRMSQASSPTPR